MQTWDNPAVPPLTKSLTLSICARTVFRASPIVAAALLLVHPLSVATQRMPATGAILGRVLRAGTNEPVAGVWVSAHRGEDVFDTPSQTATSNGAGEFHLMGLDPGTYALRFEVDGFVTEYLGEKRIPGGRNVKEVLVAPAETARNIVMRLTPTAIVSGRVLETTGQPVVGVPVRLVRERYSFDGGMQLDHVDGESAETNDRGEYRLFGIKPGRYYVSVGGPDRAAEGFSQTYYPNATRLTEAEEILVREGSDNSGIHFTLTRTRRYRVRGRVIDERTGQPPPSASISADLPNLMQGAFVLKANPYDSATGVFEISGLAPGEHNIGAQVFGSSTPCDIARSALSGLTFISPDGPPILSGAGSTLARVGDADLDGVVVTVRRAGCLMGSVSTDGSAMPGFGFGLVSTEKGSASNSAQVRTNGALAVNGLMPGVYRISGLRLPRGYYVKTAIFNGTDVLSHPLRFDGSGPGRLQITLGSKVAQLEGTVTDAKSQPAANVYVVLVPDSIRDRSDLYETTVTQENGTFKFPGVAPGDYRVFAWESIEAYSWLVPQVLGRYELKGPPIHLEESARKTIDVRVIPAEGKQ